MQNRNPMDWMLSEAIDTLARAERLHRQFFQLGSSGGTGEPSWQPPIDVLETERELLVFVALPGVAPEQVTAVIEGDVLVVAGRRTLPPELRDAVIHHLELPQGRFERRVPLPPGRYSIRPACRERLLGFQPLKDDLRRDAWHSREIPAKPVRAAR